MTMYHDVLSKIRDTSAWINSEFVPVCACKSDFALSGFAFIHKLCCSHQYAFNIKSIE